jgi:hypothetical protein
MPTLFSGELLHLNSRLEKRLVLQEIVVIWGVDGGEGSTKSTVLVMGLCEKLLREKKKEGKTHEIACFAGAFLGFLVGVSITMAPASCQPSAPGVKGVWAPAEGVTS